MIMGITSLQVCMDSDWLQGTISEDNNNTGGGGGILMDHSNPMTPPSGEDMLACSRPLIERRLRPPHEQSLKCPRCESTHTKFCYYNNYSLSQPRYFCKTCRRYWTKGGTLRNIPVGGGCRKNKKQSSNSKKPSNESSPTSSSLILHQQNNNTNTGFSSGLSNYLNINDTNNNNNNNNIQTDLHLSFPDQIHYSSLHAANLFNATNPNFMLDNHNTPIEFMDNNNKYHESLIMGNNINGHHHENNFGGLNNNFHGINCASPFGMSNSFDHHHGISSTNVLENCQRLMINNPYENHHQQNYDDHHQNHLELIHHDDVKPNAKILSIEWHDHLQQQACNSDAGKEALMGYNNFGGVGSWTGLMNGYGSSATNPLV